MKLKQNNKKSYPEKSYLRKISDIAILGGMSAIMVAGLVGCDSGGSKDNNDEIKQVAQKKGAIVKLQEQQDGSYKILDEMPSSDGSTTIIVKDLNGNERILPPEEVDRLVAEEAKKIDNGTSNLTSSDGGGLGIGGAILASAAGALIGSYIGNKLFGNSNFQANQQRSYNSPSAYQRSQSNMGRTTSGTSATSATTSSARTNTPSNTRSGFYSGGNQGASNVGGTSTSSASS